MFDFSEFAQASLAIQLHVVFATLGLVLGGYIFLRRKGDRWHKLAGRAFVAATLLTASTSFFIHEIDLWRGWSPVHLISIYVFYSSGYAIWAVRKGRITEHKKSMISLFVSGYIIAGALTFLPERLMNDIFVRPFLGPSGPGESMMDLFFSWAVPALVIAVALFLWWRRARPSKTPDT